MPAGTRKATHHASTTAWAMVNFTPSTALVRSIVSVCATGPDTDTPHRMRRVAYAAKRAPGLRTAPPTRSARRVGTAGDGGVDARGRVTAVEVIRTG